MASQQTLQTVQSDMCIVEMVNMQEKVFKITYVNVTSRPSLQWS